MISNDKIQTPKIDQKNHGLENRSLNAYGTKLNQHQLNGQTQIYTKQ